MCHNFGFLHERASLDACFSIDARYGLQPIRWMLMDFSAIGWPSLFVNRLPHAQ
jgi:hypothetical protein